MKKKGLKSAVLAASVAAMFSVSTGVQAAEGDSTTDPGTTVEGQEQDTDQAAVDQEEADPADADHRNRGSVRNRRSNGGC